MITSKTWNRLKVGNVLKHNPYDVHESYWVIVERLETYGWSPLFRLQCLSGGPSENVGVIITVGRYYSFLDHSTLIETE